MGALRVEALEARLMLDASSNGLPPSIVVGRTLSSYFAGGVQGGSETITYTVYNEQADDVTGVLLTSSLESGVSYVDASVQPDRSGQDLAWSLGTIPGYGRASVTLTVALDGSNPLQLDTGAHAFATLNAGAVSDAAPAAALRAGSLADPTLLATTPDANTADPFIQEQAAKLDYDPQAIFNYLHHDVGYNSYLGSVRGARGTLWSSAGNALDVASLGVALMRASGIPAQYVSGTLSTSQAQSLILSMFPSSYQTVGHIPAGTVTADPANDAQLLSETESHYWFQFDAGSGMQDADPLMAGAAVGQAFTSPTGTFSEVDDALREKTRIMLTAEIYSQASALFGLGGGLSRTVVLDQTFNDVDLVGRPVTIGQFVTSSSIGAIFTATTNTYSPYLELGDAANPDPTLDQIIRGTDFQEVLTNFPLGSQALTGLFLDVTLSGPNGASLSSERTLLDRIGYGVRQNGGGAGVAIDPTGVPALTDYDKFTVNVLSGLQAAGPVDLLARRVQQEGGAVQTLPASSDGGKSAQLLLTDFTRLAGEMFLTASDQTNAQFADYVHVVQYAVRPRVIITTSAIVAGPDATGMANFSIDLSMDSVRSIPYPEQNVSAVRTFNAIRGLIDNVLEGNVLARSGSAGMVSVTAANVFSAALDQGIGFAVIDQDGLDELSGLGISADAKEQISTSVLAGRIVVVPRQGVQLNGQAVTSWYEVDPQTGDIVGRNEDGSHGGIASQYVAVYLAIAGFALGTVYPGIDGALGGIIDGILLGVFYKLGPKGAIRRAEILKAAQQMVDIVNKTPLSDLDKKAFKLFLENTLRAFIGDPPIPPMELGVVAPEPSDLVTATLPVTAGTPAGTVSGAVRSSAISASGILAATWDTQGAASQFTVSTLQVAAGTVVDGQGQAVGSGAIGLGSSASASISGEVSYRVVGSGMLAFYGEAGSTLAVSGDWTSYSATASGAISITLTTAGLTLNGTTLPAGKYTITASAASLGGSGATSSPSFSGSVAITATSAVVELGPGTGTLSVGGKPLDPEVGTTLAGYDGTVNVSANGTVTDAVTLDGAADNVLRVSAGSTPFAADQNTPVTFQPVIETNLAGEYTLTAQAPAGWTVAIDADGKITATPAPGLQGGTYPIRVVAQSTTDPDLVAQTTFDVTVTATQPGITLEIDRDPVFTVPYNGAELPTAFLASIRNLGPTADTYTLSSSNVPAGFSLQESVAEVTVPGGRTGNVGLYLAPDPGQPLPAPGTVLNFDVTATSTADPSITRTVTVSFTVPAIDAVAVTGSPSVVNMTPGATASVDVTVTNAGNVAETITLTSSASSGLAVGGLSTVTLQPGESTTETITLTPDASTPLNRHLTATITATYGTSGVSTTLQLPVNVVVPGAAAIADASTAANQLGRPALAARLNDLSVALTNLVQNPTDAVARSQAAAALNTVIGLLGADPYMASFIAPLRADAAALGQSVTAADVQAATTALGNHLDAVGSTLLAEAENPFTFSFQTNSQIGQPQVATTYQLVLQNTGSQATTYDLVLSGLPAGVTGTLSQSSITLDPGQVTPGSGVPSLIVTVTSNSATEIVPFSFTVTANPQGVPQLGQTVTGQFTARNAFVRVASVATDPAFTEPGGQVEVSTRILNAVNKQQEALVSYTVKDSVGTVIFTSPPTSTTLSVLATLTDVDLGNLDTTGFALGQDTITVTVTDTLGAVLATGTGSILIGTPVTATLTTTPTTVPSGTATVTTTLTIQSQETLVGPLGVVSQTSQPNAVGVAHYGNFVYVGTNSGINAYDVTDPAHPQLARTFGFSATLLEVHGDKLYAVRRNGGSGRFQFRTYSLADPSNPTILGTATYSDGQEGIPYGNPWHMVVTDTTAFVSVWGFTNLLPNDIKYQVGDIIAIDVSDPTTPHFVSALKNTYGTTQDGIGQYLNIDNFGGDGPTWEVVQVDADTLLVAGSTVAGDDTQNGQGVVLVVDISDPAHMTIARQLVIPGTVQAVGISIDGDRALVTGSTTGWQDLGSMDFTGNEVLAVLDISDPRNPALLGTRTLDRSSQGPYSQFTTSLGNGRFAFSTQYQPTGTVNPSLFVVNINDPQNLTISNADIPDFSTALDASGNYVYTTSSSGLTIYQIDAPDSIPVTAQATIPSGVSIVPGSFSLAPVSTILNADGSRTLEWEFNLTASLTNQTISWQSTVSGIQPGQSIVVARNGTVQFSTLPLNANLVDLSPFVNSALIAQPSGQAVPAGGTPINVGGVSFSVPTYQGSGTGVVATTAATPSSPSVIDIPVNFQDVASVYTLINSFFGQSGYLDGTVEFFGTNGAYASFDLVQGMNIRDYNNLIFTNTLPEGTPSVEFLNGQARLDRQTFDLPSSFIGQTLNKIRLSGFGNNPTGQPILAAVTVATAADPSTVSTFDLSDQVVAGQQIIGIDPVARTAAPGESASYTVTLINPISSPVTYTMSVQGVDAGWVGLPTSVDVAANALVTMTLVLSPGAAAILGDYGFSVTAVGSNGATGSVQADLILQGSPVQPDAQSHGIVASVTPTQATAGQGTSARYVVRLTNTGSVAEAFHLDLAGLPSGVTAAFSQDDLTIPPGASNFREISLVLTAAAGTPAGASVFSVTATSDADPVVTNSASASLSVNAAGVSLVLSPPTATPGAGYQVTVTNTGTATDTFDLALGGPGAAVARLATSQVTLAPGESRDVPISTTAADFALPGSLLLSVIATSQAEPSVLAGASAALTVAATQGMTAGFTPDTTALDAPGMATFQLMVHNTGNTEDSYEASIIGANGPVAAYLVGLDGRPTQSISTFRLPALADGVVTLKADLGDYGAGKVTVRVRSLTTNAIAATAGATVTSAASPTPNPPPTPTPTPTPSPTPTALAGPEVTRVVRYGIHTSPTRIVLNFSAPLDSASALKRRNYRIIGPGGNRIRILSAVYDPATMTVTLRPSRRISIHHPYRLIVDGASPSGVTGATGIHLVGKPHGLPGSNFKTVLTWRNLGTTVPARFRHPKAFKPAQHAHRSQTSPRPKPSDHAILKH